MMIANKSRHISLPEDLFSHKIYWLNKLSGELPETNLITDYVRPVLYSGKNRTITFDLSNDLSEAIIKFTKNSDFSIYLVFLAALNIFLQKYTSHNDVILGSPIYKQVSSDDLINQVVPLRSSVTNITFKDFLLQVKDTTIDAYSHQNYPFAELVRLLTIPKTQSRCPIFDIVFLLENIHDRDNLADLNNDLTVSLLVNENTIKGKISYKESLFKAETIKTMTRHYVNVITRVIENINIKISDIVLLEESEKHQLLEFNKVTGNYPVQQTLHKLFEKQVEQTANKIAVVYERIQLTYQEVNEKANQLARFLQNKGVIQGDFVGILKERNTNFLIAILAILKVGGAYVPIDSTYPPDRIRYMLSNSEVKVLLTGSSFLNILTDLLEDCSHLKCITCLDVKSNNIAIAKLAGVNIYAQVDFDKLPKENLGENNTGIDPAYTIYTSGSTGLPKGAIITHGGAINHIYAQFDALEFTEEFSFLQSAPASSDISVWQFVAPLLIGGKTVIVDTQTVCNPEKLFNVIKEEKLSIVELVPVLLRELLDYISHLSSHQRLLPNLKWMMVTGEPVSVDLVNQWLRMYPSIRVVNAYGPTEAADDITQFIVETPLPENQRTVPIGKPLANLNLYILDGQMQLVPIGVPGEICVSGFGVGKGYWKNEERTQLSFVPNPFPSTATLPGTNRDLIYKTGDLGRWLPDGNIEFLGRIDHQVKIRGFRIELGEIEAVLSQHSCVQETVVLAAEDELGNQRLLAYVVANANLAPTSSELRSFLKEKLPDYMVPSAFMLLEAIPRTPNGKVDRRALPVLDRLRPKLEEFIAPHTTVEKQLALIWAQVIGVEQVGIHDNFFELGGDSILSLQIVSRANQAGLHLTLKDIFQHQTIAELATVAETTQPIQAEQGLVTGSVPLTPIQHYFFEQDLLDRHHWNQAFLLEVQQTLDPKLLEQAVQQLLVHHDALRLRFEHTESGWQQIDAKPDEIVLFSCVDLSGVPASKQESALEAAATELQGSLNLSQGPLVRVALFNLGIEKTSRLLLVIHHLVVDGVSWRILVEDLQATYQQLERGEAIKLPSKTTSFKQWSEQLREYASAAVQQELDYWLAEPRKQVSRLPVDYPGAANTVASARIISARLSVAETKVLLQEVPAAYRTQINDVLLTALVQAFAQWTGERCAKSATASRSLLVNLEGHGREEIFDNVDLSRTVGWFTSIFPVLLDLGEASHPGEALKAVKDQLRGIPNRGIGYGMLRYLSGNTEIVEQLRSLPQASVVFNYLGQFDQTLSESSLFKLAQESSGQAYSLRDNRSELLNINGFVVSGQLQLNWMYSEAVHHRATIEDLAQRFVEALRSIIAHCQSPQSGGFTPSDFPLVELNQDELDQALGMVEF